ncbi:hypothetical protein LY90DRAFT_676726 [Neocallimastix californiae]|uniref:SH3 domain-containing protein n=1 Tax=Neocallimastix californiae TaxID=1754190 RepID=A0A1Y2AD60_9FUNG|nr:hypothetical protein LY90DRAFT_676726 [Neocallimastix californiae]|eukprot:ORY20488.1 hypothetical protein LY90DRAFT_676726 [Neocallimastix californiae]
MNLWRVYRMLQYIGIGIVICIIGFIVVYFIFEIKDILIENIKCKEASLLAKTWYTAGKCYTEKKEEEREELTLRVKEKEELILRVKDRIYIIEVYPDGRAYGKNVITEQTGIFPLCYLKNEAKKERMKDLKEKKKLINVLSNFFLLLSFIFLVFFILLDIMALIWIYNGYD